MEKCELDVVLCCNLFHFALILIQCPVGSKTACILGTVGISNHDFLFPAKRHAQKDPKTLGGQISALIDRELGLKITPHQFRHAAGAIILKRHPGNYELVRRVLGHKSLAATTRFYIGLESQTAAQQFVELVEGMLPDDPANRNTRNRK